MLRSWRAALLVVLALVGGQLAGISPAAAANCSTSSSPTTGLVSEAHPVVLVHGWRGEPLAETRSALEGQLGDGWQLLLFDYHSDSDEWAASDAVAGCLADYIQGVADAHRVAGGDGLVYLVAHSMGGLAVRFAVGDRPVIEDSIGGVVTLATPHQGSPWGNSGAYTVLVDELNKHGGLGPMPLPGSRASICLATHQAGRGLPTGCEAPPYLPASIAVHQLEGSATIARTFFGWQAYDVDLGGDSIVPSSSGGGYIGSAPGPVGGQQVSIETASCRAEWRALGAELWGVAGVLGTLGADISAMGAVSAGQPSPALVELLAVANVRMPCSHLGITTMPQAMRSTATALRAQAAAHVPLPSAPAPYHLYTNGRFGFTCETPAEFEAEAEPSNGDGLQFVSADGTAQVTCYGSNNSLAESVEQGFASAVSSWRAQGATVTYERLVGSTFTISGVLSDGSTYFQRTVWGAGSNNTVFWSYPSSAQGQLGAAVEHSVQTFKAGAVGEPH